MKWSPVYSKDRELWSSSPSLFSRKFRTSANRTKPIPIEAKNRRGKVDQKSSVQQQISHECGQLYFQKDHSHFILHH